MRPQPAASHKDSFPGDKHPGSDDGFQLSLHKPVRHTLDIENRLPVRYSIFSIKLILMDNYHKDPSVEYINMHVEMTPWEKFIFLFFIK